MDTLRFSRRELIGYGFAVTGAILFSSKAVVVKLAYDHPVDAETLLALRMLCSVPIYLLVGGANLWRRRTRSEDWPGWRLVVHAMAVGILGYWLASYLDFLGLALITATLERLILFTYPLFVVVVGWAFFGGRLHYSLVPAFAISYGGLALIFLSPSSVGPSGGSSTLVLGGALVLACALAFALYQLLAKAPIAKLGSELFTSVAMTGACIAAVLVFVFTHRLDQLRVVNEILPHAVFLAVGATVIPSYFLNAALARISAQANGAIGMISPISTILLAALFLGEPLSMTEAMGAGLVLAGVVFFVWSQRA